MEQEELTAETNESATQIAESGEIGLPESEKVVQTPEQNREFARIRRNQEREKFEQETRKRVRLEVVRELTGGINRFTGKPIETEDDVAEYIDYVTRENQGNETTTGTGAGTQRKSDDKNQEWYEQDKLRFFSENPDFTMEQFTELMQNEDFIEFSSGKVGNMPLSEIYSSYNKFISKFEEIAVEKAKRMYLRRFSSPGSLMPETTKRGGNQWTDMTEQEFETAIQNAKKGYYTNKK